MSYYNTTNESSTALMGSEIDADNQWQAILQVFRKVKQASPSQVSAIFPQWPLTSIRRAITDLTSDGQLIKTDSKQIGIYGKPEYVWSIRHADTLFNLG